MLAWKLCTAVAATALLAAASARADDAPPGDRGWSAQAMSGEDHAVATLAASTGSACLHRVFPTLQAQLNLPKDQGLVVEELQPKPGGQGRRSTVRHSTQGQRQAFDWLHDAATNQSVKDGKLTLELVRAGKHETVTVNASQTARP